MKNKQTYVFLTSYYIAIYFLNSLIMGLELIFISLGEFFGIKNRSEL